MPCAEPRPVATEPRPVATEPRPVATEPRPVATHPRPAARALGLGPSLIRRMEADAPPGTVSLGLGEPGWALPEVARRALAAPPGRCGYGPGAGLPALRAAVAAEHALPEENVMVAAGSQAALFALFQAYLGPGNAALLPDPGFAGYPLLAAAAGAEAVTYPVPGALDPGAFGAALRRAPHARLAVINHPANPTGAGASLAALRAVADACAERGVLLVSDEVYRELHLPGHSPVPSLLETGAPGAGHGVVVSSVSKAWGAPGLRVGWALGTPAVLAPVRALHGLMNTAPARPSQAAAAALLRHSGAVLAEARQELALRFATLRRELPALTGAAPAPPAGGFYHWLPLPGGAHADPLAFCLRLRDQGGVTVIPGLAFGPAGRGFVRLSWGGPPAELQAGLRRLRPFWPPL